MLWTWYFSQWPEEQRLWISLSLQLSQIANKIRIHHRTFCGDKFTSKKLKKLSLVESLFNIKHEYSLQTKIWKTIRKMYLVEFPFNAGARIQSTAYYWTVLKIHSENAQKGKDVLNFLKFKKNLSCLSFFNARTLQSSILTSANTDFKKNVSFWVIWNISKISQKNVYNETIWLTKHLYKNHFIHFHKVLENY